LSLEVQEVEAQQVTVQRTLAVAQAVTGQAFPANTLAVVLAQKIHYF
jgi:hypothetical protein